MKTKDLKKIIYSMLKEILEGDSIPKASDYSISEDEFYDIVLLMKNEGYLNPNNVEFFITGGISIEKSINTVTMKGVEFLEDNNYWSKMYKGIKEIKEFLTL